MSKGPARNLEKDGVLINVLFFCKALNIKKPEKVEDPIRFMEQTVESDSLSWSEIAERVAELREEYKERRRIAKKMKQRREEQTDKELFAQFNRSQAKFRDCLSCGEEFFSKFGNRLCDRCKASHNSYLD